MVGETEATGDQKFDSMMSKIVMPDKETLIREIISGLVDSGTNGGGKITPYDAAEDMAYNWLPKFYNNAENMFAAFDQSHREMYKLAKGKYNYIPLWNARLYCSDKTKNEFRKLNKDSQWANISKIFTEIVWVIQANSHLP